MASDTVTKQNYNPFVTSGSVTSDRHLRVCPYVTRIGRTWTQTTACLRAFPRVLRVRPTTGPTPLPAATPAGRQQARRHRLTAVPALRQTGRPGKALGDPSVKSPGLSSRTRCRSHTSVAVALLADDPTPGNPLLQPHPRKPATNPEFAPGLTALAALGRVDAEQADPGWGSLCGRSAMVRPPRENADRRLYRKDGTIFFSVKVPLTYSRAQSHTDCRSPPTAEPRAAAGQPPDRRGDVPRQPETLQPPTLKPKTSDTSTAKALNAAPCTLKIRR